MKRTLIGSLLALAMALPALNHAAAARGSQERESASAQSASAKLKAKAIAAYENCENIGAVNRLCTEYIKLAPGDFEGYLYRGMSESDREDLYMEAIADFKKAIQLNPRCAEAYARCAKVEQVHGLDQAADLDARQALKLLPNPSSAKDFSLRCIASAACTELSYDSSKFIIIEPTFKIGSINYYTAPHIGIRIPHKAFLERQKAMALAQSKTARDFLVLGQLNDDDNSSAALLNFDRALKCNPNSAIAWANRAKVLLTQNDIKQALESCNRAIQLDKQIDCYYQRALLRQDLAGAIADMQTDYAHNRDTWADDTVRFSRLALMEKAYGNVDGAISELNKLLAIEPASICREQRAELLVRQNRLAEALSDYDQLICMTSSNSTRLSRAALRFRTGDICGFWQDVSRAIWK